MWEFKQQVRTALMADATLVAMLATVPGLPNDPAIYLNHISTLKQVYYPAVSLFMSSGADPAVRAADTMTLLVDVWVAEIAAKAGQAAGMHGAWAIYRRVKACLHMKWRDTALHNAAYRLGFISESPGASVMEDFDENQKLFHLASKFDVRLIAVGAELSVSNAGDA